MQVALLIPEGSWEFTRGKSESFPGELESWIEAARRRWILVSAVSRDFFGQLGGGSPEQGDAGARYEELMQQCCGIGEEDGEEDGEEGEKEEVEEEDVKVKMQRLKVADLEARAVVKFHKVTFFKELVYHIFFPLSAPLIWYMEGGWLALVNRGFASREQRVVGVVQWFMAVSFYVLNVVNAMYVVRARSWSFFYEMALVDVLWVLRNSVVATKYAFTSQMEMQEMRTKRVPVDVHDSRTLLVSWRDPIPKHVLKAELYLSAARCKMLSPSFFKLENARESMESIRDMVDDVSGGLEGTTLSFWKEADQWVRLPESGDLPCHDHLPVHVYAAHILWQSSSLSRLRRVGHTLLSQHLIKCSVGLGLLHGALPEIGRAIFGGRAFPGPVWTKYLVGFVNFSLIAFTMWSNVAFMMVGVLDFRRRHYVSQKLDELLRYGVYMGDRYGRGEKSTRRSQSGLSNNSLGSRSSRSSTALSGPGIVVDFIDPDTLLAWWVCRQMAQNFGLGFHRRIKFYTTYFACYCGILLVYVGLRLFAGIKREDLYVLITVTFSIYVFLFLLALMVWPGGDVNLTRIHHGATLAHRKLSLQRRIRLNHKRMTAEELTKAKTAVDMMTFIAEAVKWDNGKMQMSICGFEAGEQLISVIVATVTASLSIGVGQIAQNGLS